MSVGVTFLNVSLVPGDELLDDAALTGITTVPAGAQAVVGIVMGSASDLPTRAALLAASRDQDEEVAAVLA